MLPLFKKDAVTLRHMLGLLIDLRVIKLKFGNSCLPLCGACLKCLMRVSLTLTSGWGFKKWFVWEKIR